MVVLLEVSPISTQDLWISARMTIGFFATSLTKALLPWLLSLPRRPAQGRVLVVPNPIYLRITEATVLLGTFKQQIFFLAFPSVSQPNPVSELCRQFLWSHASSTVRTYIDRCVPFQIMSSQFNLPQVNSNQGLEKSQGWSRKIGGPWSKFQVSLQRVRILMLMWYLRLSFLINFVKFCFA